MFMFKKKRCAKGLDIAAVQLQVEMVQRLLDIGYSWNQIYYAMGFSEAWLNFTQSRILKKQTEK